MNGIAALLPVAEDRAGDAISASTSAARRPSVHQRAAVGAGGLRLRDPAPRCVRAANLELHAADARWRSRIWSIGAPGRWSTRVGTTSLLVVLFVFRACFVKPAVAWIDLEPDAAVPGAVAARSELLRDRRQAGQRADRGAGVPAGVLHLAGDLPGGRERRPRSTEGVPPLEKLDDEKVLVWPDLVYTELICMIALTAFLIFWAIWLQAPLEEPASSVKTPNPSKAPWYFLGLQEMLVYYDPWMAGVVLPSLIVVGLMAIPYIDFNKKGNGYYTINERKFAYIIVPVRLPGAVDHADHSGHAPARSELELLRSLRVLGRPQGRSAEQRQPVGVFLAVVARAEPAEGAAGRRFVDADWFYII